MASLTVESIRANSEGLKGQQIAKRRLMLTADRNHVVSDTDPKAAFLLAAKGCPIPAGEAKRLGLVDGDLPHTKTEPPRTPVETQPPEAPSPRKRK